MSLQPRPAPAAPERRYVPPTGTQLAALCWRRAATGEREVLLVTSSTGRWILPKGWPISGMTDPKAALTEAWEEAGVARAKVARKPIGQFIAAKRTAEGDDLPCLCKVYSVRVHDMAEDFPERGRRDLRWVSPDEAADLVTEDGLREILAAF
jgi:8-oxo-dGTP pyrophosphatase MutT (NUDIX family)